MEGKKKRRAKTDLQKHIYNRAVKIGTGTA